MNKLAISSVLVMLCASCALGAVGDLTFSNGVDSFTAAIPAANGSIQFFGIISDFELYVFTS